MAIRKVYNIDTGKVYSSAAKAALAVGVDPSNLLKVLKGARQSAGGFRFVYADNLSGEQLQAAAAARLQAIPKRLQERQKRQRQRRSREYTEARKQARQTLLQANKAITEAKKAGLYAGSPEMQDLAALADEIGNTKTGLIDASIDNLEEFDMEELLRIHYRTQDLLGRVQVAIDERKGQRESLAFEFGLSTGNEWKKYEPMQKEIFNVLKRAGEDNRKRGSDPVFAIVQEAITKKVPVNALRALINRLNQYFDEQKSDENLDEVMAQWYKSAFPDKEDQSAAAGDLPEIPLAP